MRIVTETEAASTTSSPSSKSSPRANAAPRSADLDIPGRLGAFLEANWSSLLGLLAAGGVVAVGLAGYEWLSHRGERQAEEAFYSAEANFMKTKEGFERAKMKALMPQFAPPPAAGQTESAPASGDLTKDYGPSIEAFESVVAQHPKSRAAQQAALHLAWAYSEYKQPEKALAAIEKTARHSSTGDLLGALTFLALGDARAATGQCAKAVEDWARIVGESGAGYLKGEAMVKSGVCYESMGDSAKASDMYRRASQEHAETSAGQTARSLLRAIELKAGAVPAAAAGKAG